MTNSLGFHVILQLFEGHCSYLRRGVLTVIQLGIYGKEKNVRVEIIGEICG